MARVNDLSTMAGLILAGVGLLLLLSGQCKRGMQRHCRLPGIRADLWLLTLPDLRVGRIRVVWDAILAAYPANHPAKHDR